ncbi:hypothetical protein B0T26DRAFT_203615 [Lasiosphaeria miniovina]|uniref:Secreted protein n=1 Tax=Lasiosphaeria miniovina TaxID=1954250 RepID=A0AA40AU97_9PEZI|nr:uncharacterized protein B0T26DRAFT_203615 [Lasiosphaeria miniovina]KAK0722128.1 hypothetical protein B0T26DRAFT_203615 [Lasiosphaeria miniovina]
MSRTVHGDGLRIPATAMLGGRCASTATMLAWGAFVIVCLGARTPCDCCPMMAVSVLPVRPSQGNQPAESFITSGSCKASRPPIQEPNPCNRKLFSLCSHGWCKAAEEIIVSVKSVSISTFWAGSHVRFSMYRPLLTLVIARLVAQH